MSNIYLIIPTYNEKMNIVRLIGKIADLPVSDLTILVVDDNSPDNTASAVESLKERHSVRLIKRPAKLGLGSAHIAGFKYALAQGAEVVLTMDADFSHNPKDIPALIQAVKEHGYDVSLGSRRVSDGGIQGWNWWRKFCSKGASWFSRLMLGLKTKDVTTGFRCYKRHVLENLDLDSIRSNGYSFLEEMIFLCEKKGFKIKEVPIIFVDRKEGRSKLSRKEMVKFFITIFRLRFFN